MKTSKKKNSNLKSKFEKSFPRPFMLNWEEVKTSQPP